MSDKHESDGEEEATAPPLAYEELEDIFQQLQDAADDKEAALASVERLEAAAPGDGADFDNVMTNDHMDADDPVEATRATLAALARALAPASRSSELRLARRV